jgi:hypothetical protein
MGASHVNTGFLSLMKWWRGQACTRVSGCEGAFFVLLSRFHVLLNRRAGANQYAVALRVIDATHGRPVFI